MQCPNTYPLYPYVIKKTVRVIFPILYYRRTQADLCIYACIQCALGMAVYNVVFNKKNNV